MIIRGGHILSGNRKQSNVIKMKKRQNPLAGIMLILFAIYILVLFVQSLRSEKISIYEVTQNKLADDDTVRGIILRDEHLVRAKTSGYINYYVSEGAYVGVNTSVYSTDSSGLFNEALDKVGADSYSLSEADTKVIRTAISEYRSEFKLSDYGRIKNFRYSLENSLLKMTTAGLLKKANTLLKNNNLASLNMIKAGKTGIISFCVDGFEKTTIDTINENTFKNMDDNWKQLRQAKKVSKGDVVYKLITNDNWSVVIPITSKQYKKLYKKNTVTVVIKKDNNRMTPEVTTFTENSKYYAKLDFSRDMINYIDNRYIDIKLEFDQVAGLKVPVSSIIQKKFFVVQDEYIIKDKDTGNLGVYIKTYDKNGKEERTFRKTKIYYKDEKGQCYIDAALFSIGDLLTLDENVNDKTISLSRTAILDGVYCCNDGYCNFKRVDIKYSNAEYAIVNEDALYGLQIYDHIILNPDLINENEII